LSDDVKYPSIEQALKLYDQIVKATGGTHGFLSKSNLEYILDSVRDIGERVPRKQAITKKASFLLYNIIVVHPFLNGNKRTSFGLVELFLEANGYRLSASTAETYRFLLKVASRDASELEVESWVARNLTELKRE
jgi:death-on-curing protein